MLPSECDDEAASGKLDEKATSVFFFITYGDHKQFPFSVNSTSAQTKIYAHEQSAETDRWKMLDKKKTICVVSDVCVRLIQRVVGRGNEHGLPRAGITLVTLREALCTMI